MKNAKSKMSLTTLKQQVCDANLALARSGLVLGTFGNVSGIDRERGLVAIKPSGVPYDAMRPEQMVVVSLDTGLPVEGSKLGRDPNVAGRIGRRSSFDTRHSTLDTSPLRPSSDLATHLELYRAFSGIGGVVHTHSLHATAWAQAGRDIPALGTTHADYFAGPIPCTRKLRPAEIRGPYEQNTGLVIVERFGRAPKHVAQPPSAVTRPPAAARIGLGAGRSTPEARVPHSRGAIGLDPLSMPAVLVAGHGPFTWGDSPADAVHNAVLLEYVATLAMMTLAIRPACPPISPALLDKHFSRKHGAGAYYGQRRKK